MNSNSRAVFGGTGIFASVLVVGLLVLHGVLGMSAAGRGSITFDETCYITGGYSQWILKDFRLAPEAVVFFQRWATLPLLRGHHVFPDLEQKAWKESNPWVMADQFLFGLGNDLEAIILQCRLMMLLLCLATGLLVYAWSRRLFGVAGGILSLVLYVFSPTILGNGCLVASDLIAAGWLLAATWSAWRLLHEVSVKTLVLAALSFAGLWLTKFSALLIMPVVGICLLVRIFAKKPLVVRFRGATVISDAPGRQLAVLSAGFLAVCLVTWVAIWTAYGFRYSPYAPGSGQGSHLMDEQVLAGDRFWGRLDGLHVLPRAFTYGLAYTLEHAQARPAFLNGQFSDRGWPWFYPYCMLVKSPLSLFAIIGFAVAGILVWWKERRRERAAAEGDADCFPMYELAPLAVLLLVYWEAAITSHIDIGNRHILPVYLPTFIIAGGAALWLRRLRTTENGRLKSWSGLCVAAILASALLYVVASVRTWPHSLAYFNALAGGPAGGYRHLVDSSLDWGQGLPDLVKWIDRNRAKDEEVYFSYFGSARPGYYGVRARLLPSFLSAPPACAPPEPLHAGLYAFSATMIQPLNHDYPGPWSRDHEQLWQETLAWFMGVSSIWSDQGKRREVLARNGEEFMARCFRQYEQLRFSRLCSYLRQRQPVAQPGYSTLVFRLTEEDVRQAIEGPAVIEAVAPARAIGGLPR